MFGHGGFPLLCGHAKCPVLGVRRILRKGYYGCHQICILPLLCSGCICSVCAWRVVGREGQEEARNPWIIPKKANPRHRLLKKQQTVRNEATYYCTPGFLQTLHDQPTNCVCCMPVPHIFRLSLPGRLPDLPRITNLIHLFRAEFNPTYLFI